MSKRGRQDTVVSVQPKEKKARLEGVLTPSSPSFSREDVAEFSKDQVKIWVKDTGGLDEKNAKILFDGELDGPALLSAESAIKLRDLYGVSPAAADKLFNAILRLKDGTGSFLRTVYLCHVHRFLPLCCCLLFWQSSYCLFSLSFPPIPISFSSGSIHTFFSPYFYSFADFQ